MPGQRSYSSNHSSPTKLQRTTQEPVAKTESTQEPQVVGSGSSTREKAPPPRPTPPDPVLLLSPGRSPFALTAPVTTWIFSSLGAHCTGQGPKAKGLFCFKFGSTGILLCSSTLLVLPWALIHGSQAH